MDSHTFTDRTKKSIWKKLNPVWWFQNDDEQTLAEAAWFEPQLPQWQRWLIWNVLRNPLQNFRAYVVGVQDRNYTVIGKAPVMTVQRDDIGQLGWQWCLIKLLIPRPFVSYSGTRTRWYAGWQPNGFFGFKINFH